MPVIFRGADTPVGALNATTITLNKPAGVVAGDYMLAVFVGAGQMQFDPSSVPAGWTKIDGPHGDNSTSTYCIVYEKIAGASEPASYTWTWAPNIGSANGHLYAWGQTLGRVAFAAADDVTADTNLVAPSVAAPSSAQWLVSVVAAGAFNTSRSLTAPAGMTLRSPSGAVQSAIGCADQQLSASGATGTRTFTSTATEMSYGWGIVLAPLAGGARMLV